MSIKMSFTGNLIILMPTKIHYSTVASYAYCLRFSNCIGSELRNKHVLTVYLNETANRYSELCALVCMKHDTSSNLEVSLVYHMK